MKVNNISYEIQRTVCDLVDKIFAKELSRETTRETENVGRLNVLYCYRIELLQSYLGWMLDAVRFKTVLRAHVSIYQLTDWHSR